MATKENNNKLLTPEESLPRMSNDTPESVASRAKYADDVRRRLALDPSKMSFVSYSSIELTWRDQDGIHEIELPLRSLTAHESDRILDNYRGDIPDEDAPEYLMVMTEMGLKARYDKLLLAFCGDIMSVDGQQIVWSSQTDELCDRDEALKSLYALSIPGTQLENISNFIDNISIKTEIEKAEDFKKKQLRP